MSKRTALISGGILAACGLLAALIALPSRRSGIAQLVHRVARAIEPANTDAAPTPDSRHVAVRTTLVAPGPVQRTVLAFGTVEAERDAKIAARTDGIVRRLRVELGSEAVTDSPLVELDDGEQAIALRRTEADLARVNAIERRARVQAKAARTKLALAMETLETRTRERARWSDLASREMASRDRADQADVLWRQAKSAHADAVGTWDSVAAVASEVQASVDLARANRDQTALELQRCVVRAPFAGFVAERFVEVGDFVRRGTPVVRLVAHERVRLRVHVNAEDALTITRGAAVSIILPGIANLPHYANGSSGEQALSGRVAGVSVSADPRTRKFAVDVVADNALGLLREGMFARVQIDAGRLDEAILVPDEATGADEDGQFVFVIEDGKAHRRRVVLGPRQGEGRILRDGLGGPAELVTDGLGQVFDGAPIRRIGN